MSQAGILNVGGSSPAVVETLTGNSGGAVGPDGAHNINVVGSGGVTVTGNPGTNTLTITSSGMGFTWSDASGAFLAASNNGYFITGASTPTLPAAPNEGDAVNFIVDTPSTCTITANAGQQIRIGAVLTAVAGTAANTVRGDSIILVYRATGATWFSLSGPQGIWQLT